MRIERDLIGELPIKNQVYYGIQTQRAIDNFELTDNKLSQYPELIVALAYVKSACCKANAKLGLLSEEKSRAIVTACNNILDGKHHDQFPIDMIQGGAGTSSNMNMNEVLSNVALKNMGYELGQYEFIHPNTDVNMSQSTNDVYPSSIRLAVLLKQQGLLDELSLLVDCFKEKGQEFNDILKLARTQLQDAVPMTLGQEFKSFASTLNEDIRLISNNGQLLKEINLGGTAVGTGINTLSAYGPIAVEFLSESTDIEFKSAEDLIEASSDMGAFVIYSASLKRLALKLSKIANDLRLLSMGPKAGLAEISLPARQPGSSIMPGKVNPVIPEAVSQSAYQIVGKDMAITMAAEAGQLQLNAMEPLIALNLLDMQDLLSNAIKMFRTLCVEGIEANETRCKQLLEQSLGLVTALNPHLGYEKTSAIAKQALATDTPLIDLVKQQGWLSDEEIEEILVATKMTQPI